MSDAPELPPPEYPKGYYAMGVAIDDAWTLPQINSIQAPLLAEIERLKADRNGWLAANSPGDWIDELRAQLEAAQKATVNLSWPICPTCNKPCETFSTTGCIGGQQYMPSRCFVMRGDKTYHLGCEPR